MEYCENWNKWENKGSLPVSEEASEHVLSIPIYPELTNDMREFVFMKIGEFYKSE